MVFNNDFKILKFLYRAEGFMYNNLIVGKHQFDI